ncbi:hypothetical protein BCV71DRAFT_188569, partial [Rhizopus microsporus]
RNIGYHLLQSKIPCRNNLYRILPQPFPDDACAFCGELILLIILYRVAFKKQPLWLTIWYRYFPPSFVTYDSFRTIFYFSFSFKPFTGSSPGPSVIIGAILIISWQSH